MKLGASSIGLSVCLSVSKILTLVINCGLKHICNKNKSIFVIKINPNDSKVNDLITLTVSLILKIATLEIGAVEASVFLNTSCYIIDFSLFICTFCMTQCRMIEAFWSYLLCLSVVNFDLHYNF